LKYAADGLVAAGPYFRGATGWPGGGSFASSHEAAAYAAVRELARRLNGRPCFEDLPLGTLLLQAPGGVIDPATHHTSRPVLSARVEGGVFHTVKALPAIAGDPYLTRPRAAPAVPELKVVS